jgi:hypothetical protein
MWTAIDEKSWEIEKTNFGLSLFFCPKYLKAVAEVYQLDLNYYCFRKKNKILAMVSFFSKGKKIIMPENFSYSPIFIIESLSEAIYFEINDSLIELLKKSFKRIFFKFDTSFSDVRPYIWKDFEIKIKYTHLKNNNLSSHKSVVKNISKIINEEYYFEVEQPNPNLIKLNLDFLRKLGISKFHCFNYHNLLEKWTEIGYLKAFNISKNQQILCSNLVLVDLNQRKAFTILLNNVNNGDKYAHTLLYQSIINWCFKEGITEVDFCGANISNISIFKSSFNTELKTYFTVSYSRNYDFCLKIANKFRLMFQKVF